MAGLPCPKEITYRNRALLDLIRNAPHCMNRQCRAHNFGQVVPCHRDRLSFGRGAGYKAHDIPAALCGHCHNVIDGRPEGGPLLPEDERDRMWLEAAVETWLWLMQDGYLEIAS